MYEYNTYDYIRDLQYKNKALQRELDAFKSGEEYIKMEEKHKLEMAYSNRENKKLRNEIADLNRRIVTNRKHLDYYN
jgi:peptidoglycan hydrolase CwlO-like protein